MGHSPRSMAYLKAEYRAVAVAVGSIPSNLSLHGRTDMVIAGECEVPVVAGKQQGNAVVGQQRVHEPLASPARREDVEVLLEPPTHLGFIHGAAPYRRDATADSATAAGDGLARLRRGNSDDLPSIAWRAPRNPASRVPRPREDAR